MGTPNATSIVNDLITTLTAITTAGGYKTDVADVTRYIQTWDEATNRPSIGVAPGRVTYAYEHGDMLRCRMTVTLAAHVLASTAAARLTAAENILDDIIAALCTDYTRSGNAVVTTVVSSESDLGVQHAVSHQGAGASLVVELEIMWQRTTGAS